MFHYIYIRRNSYRSWSTSKFNSHNVPFYIYLDGTVNVPWSTPEYNSSWELYGSRGSPLFQSPEI